jgi:hypothetical protein
MASYPELDPDRDPQTVAAETLIRVALESRQYIAMPPKRLELERAAEEMARQLKEKAT